MDKRELTVVLTDDYLREGLDAYNRSAWKVGRPWVLVKPVGKTLWFGPVIVPGRTACWHCLALRLRANRPAGALLQQLRSDPAPALPSQGMLPVSYSLAYHMAALEVVQWIVRDEPARLENTLMTFDLANWKAEYHHVASLARCPVC